MNIPRPFERRRGELVMRTMEKRRAELFAFDVANLLGRRAYVHTHKGQRRHACTVVATYDPDACNRWPLRRVVSNPPGTTTIRIAHRRINAPPEWQHRWSSALARERYINSPRAHRFGSGRLIVRIDASTSKNMAGRYIHIDGRFLRT